jgi:diguanylate cyclase (GGDEF)-like protein
VLFIDVDDFKTVNDSLGHAAGDRLLISLAERLRSTMRPGDTAARLGGDEFAVLLENATQADASAVARRILAALSDPLPLAGQAVSVSVSIGVATDLEHDAATAEDLLRDADLAMYAAKSSRPGTFAVYAPTMHQAVMQRLEQRKDAPAEKTDKRTTARLEALPARG